MRLFRSMALCCLAALGAGLPGRASAPKKVVFTLSPMFGAEKSIAVDEGALTAAVRGALAKQHVDLIDAKDPQSGNALAVHLILSLYRDQEGCYASLAGRGSTMADKDVEELLPDSPRPAWRIGIAFGRKAEPELRSDVEAYAAQIATLLVAAMEHPGAPVGALVPSRPGPFVDVPFAEMKAVPDTPLPPTYPMGARSQRIESTVEAEVMVDPKGVPVSVRILSGHSLLHSHVLRYLMQWRFAALPSEGTQTLRRFTMSLPFKPRR